MKSISMRIIGKVQGVYYRASTRAKAEELGIKGFVRNEQDGSVYLEAEGSAEALETLKNWCKEGPLLARVEEVVVREIPLVGYTEFTVKRG